MRWPHRRQRRSDRRPDDLVPPRATAPIDVARSTGRPDIADRPDPDRPRTDWARLDRLVPPPRPTLTFDGAEFGRSVAGASSIESRSTTKRSGQLIHRSSIAADAVDAPVGVLRGVAAVSAVLTASPPAADATTPAIPSTLPDVIHRRSPGVISETDRADDGPPTTEWSASTSLTRSDLNAPFDEVRPAGQTDDEPATSISWTADDGFSTDASMTGDSTTGDSTTGEEPESRMRLVGQHGSFTDAARGEPSPGSRSTDDEEPDSAGSGEPSVRYLPSDRPRAIVEAPAADLVAIVSEATGVDVSDARIHRIDDAEAAAIRAISFTRNGEVHIPASRGSLDESSNRPIVAHELTHVAQQRLRNGHPDELSAEGRRLEAQARRVEQSIGSAVSPVYLPNPPTQPTSESGVQRLADEWLDVDDDHVDLSPLDDDRRYDWQDRPQPPAHADDDALGDVDVDVDVDDFDEHSDNGPWARQFELEHGAELQHRRDQRFDELVDEASHRRANDGPSGPTPSDVQRAQRRLDAEMPYEFGPGSGIDRYPHVTIPVVTESARPAAARPAVIADLRHRSAAADTEAASSASTPSASFATPGASARTSGQAESGNADLQRQLDEARAADQPGARNGESMSIDDLEAFLATRFDRERDLRIDVLNDKLAATDDLEIGEILSLTEDEVHQIRGIVDTELPLNVPFPQYLPLTGYGAIDKNGRFGAVNYRAQQRRESAARRTQDRARVANSAAGSADHSSSASTAISQLVDSYDAGSSSSEDTHGAALADADESPAIERTGSADDHDRDPDRQEEISELIASLSDLDVEMLSRRMYGRIRRTLRRELLIDRERDGSLADAC